MHKVSIAQSVIDRVVARRGREHIFDDLDPAKTALVVVDMQNGFMLHEVAHSPCAMAHEIVPNINRLAEAVRAAGGGARATATRGGHAHHTAGNLTKRLRDLIEINHKRLISGQKQARQAAWKASKTGAAPRDGPFKSEKQAGFSHEL